jgi:hypothetical protein
MIDDGLDRAVECGKCHRRHMLFSRIYVPDIDRPSRLRRVCPHCGDEYVRELYGRPVEPSAYLLDPRSLRRTNPHFSEREPHAPHAGS